MTIILAPHRDSGLIYTPSFSWSAITHSASFSHLHANSYLKGLKDMCAAFSRSSLMSDYTSSQYIQVLWSFISRDLEKCEICDLYALLSGCLALCLISFSFLLLFTLSSLPIVLYRPLPHLPIFWGVLLFTFSLSIFLLLSSLSPYHLLSLPFFYFPPYPLVIFSLPSLLSLLLHHLPFIPIYHLHSPTFPITHSPFPISLPLYPPLPSPTLPRSQTSWRFPFYSPPKRRIKEKRSFVCLFVSFS